MLFPTIVPPLVLFLLTVVPVQANSYIVSLFTSHKNWITEASATVILPAVPHSVKGDASIWSGITMAGPNLTGDLLQGVSSNAPKTDTFCGRTIGGCSEYCGTRTDGWCGFAYTLLDPDDAAIIGATMPDVKPGAEVRTHYLFNRATGHWDQKLYINDQLASSFTASYGQHGAIFDIAIECAMGDCAPVPAHTWTSISIVLDTADLSFKHHGPWGYNATGGEMSTEDGGKTWNIAKLHVPQQKPCIDKVTFKGRYCPDVEWPEHATVDMNVTEVPALSG